MSSKALVIKMSNWTPVKRMVRRSFLFRGLVRRFIAGDTLAEALKVAEGLTAEGYLTSLDYLGENTSSPEEAQAAKSTYIDMLEQIAKSSCAKNTNISIKLTQCGLDIGRDYAKQVLHEVLNAAERLGNFVRVDMEGSAYTGVTVDILAETWETHKNVGTVLQTYLYRTPEDLDRLVGLGMRLRLVKGAYLEPPSVAHPRKTDVDQSYINLSKKLLDSEVYHGIATHDEKIIEIVKNYVETNQIDKSTFEFQMIYGVRRTLQEKLKVEGYNMRIYIPYGDQWYPYFTRRLAERPANVFFILKSLFKG